MKLATKCSQTAVSPHPPEHIIYCRPPSDITADKPTLIASRTEHVTGGLQAFSPSSVIKAIQAYTETGSLLPIVVVGHECV